MKSWREASPLHHLGGEEDPDQLVANSEISLSALLLAPGRAKYNSKPSSTAQGCLAHKKSSPLPGPPWVPGHEATVGSYGGGLYYERGTPVGVYRVVQHSPVLEFLSERDSRLEEGRHVHVNLAHEKQPSLGTHQTEYA